MSSNTQHEQYFHFGTERILTGWYEQDLLLHGHWAYFTFVLKNSCLIASTILVHRVQKVELKLKLILWYRLVVSLVSWQISLKQKVPKDWFCSYIFHEIVNVTKLQQGMTSIKGRQTPVYMMGGKFQNKKSFLKNKLQYRLCIIGRKV